MIDLATRRSAAYWLAFAHRLEVPRRDRNGLVLVADREEHIDLVTLAQRDPDSLPPNLQRFGEAFRALLAADAIVSAQAFLVDQLAELGVRVVPITDPAYPPHLARRLTPSKAPTLLTVRGDVALLQTPGVAVSGSRKASPRGLAFARAMGGALARAGIPLVSGLAKGVDTEALQGALAAGGRVIGIAAEGILRCSAARRKEVDEGRLVVVSQYDPNARWQAWQAMERNRTIAGFSRALVIADCVAEGGTTDQFMVHRELGLPVVVRRGAGEGALIADLAGRPGASTIQWEDGPVTLPSLLAVGAAIRCEARLEGGEIVVSIRAPADAPREAVAEALAKVEWPRPDSVDEGGRGGVDGAAERPSPAYPTLGDGVEEPATDPGDEALLRALRDATEPMTRDQIQRAVGESKGKFNSRLRRLVEVGKVGVDKSGRVHRFSLVAREPLPLFRVADRP